MLDDISDNAAVWLGLTSPISRGLLKAAAVVFAVKSSFRLVDHISRITADPDSERAIRAHIDTVKQKYAYMAGHVDQEYFSDQGLALKIPRGAVIVDVGAHFGCFPISALSFYQCNPNARTADQFHPLIFFLLNNLFVACSQCNVLQSLGLLQSTFALSPFRRSEMCATQRWRGLTRTEIKLRSSRSD